MPVIALPEYEELEAINNFMHVLSLYKSAYAKQNIEQKINEKLKIPSVFKLVYWYLIKLCN